MEVRKIKKATASQAFMNEAMVGFPPWVWLWKTL